jgi:DNA (cytosine-5)-methyltransferase 1
VSRTFSFYEFFAGGGMARLGLGEGWACLLANDFDPLKTRTYAGNFGEDHLKAGDVFALTAKDLPGQADLAWASSPCQDFSLAGKRAGLSGGRSSAFFGFWKLMRALNADGRAPKVIVIENVVGLLTANGGADFTALCQALSDEGYGFGALEIDARLFLPQSRPRVFVVACKGEPPAGLIGDSLFQTRAVREASERLPRRLAKQWRAWRLEAPPPRNTDLAALLEDDAAVAWHEPEVTERWLSLMSPAHRRAAELRRNQPRSAGTMFRRMRGGEQRAEVRFDGVAGCLRTPRGGSSRQALLLAGDGQIRTRLLTAREGARLMGLPEDYCLPRGATAALQVIGDGVAVPVAAHLARVLVEPLLESLAHPDRIQTLAAE